MSTRSGVGDNCLRGMDMGGILMLTGIGRLSDARLIRPG